VERVSSHTINHCATDTLLSKLSWTKHSSVLRLSTLDCSSPSCCFEYKSAMRSSWVWSWHRPSRINRILGRAQVVRMLRLMLMSSLWLVVLPLLTIIYDIVLDDYVAAVSISTSTICCQPTRLDFSTWAAPILQSLLVCPHTCLKEYQLPPVRIPRRRSRFFFLLTSLLPAERNPPPPFFFTA
jgi:hypothetical protein